MLTRIQIQNFKRMGDVEVELGNTVVFVGPNNSGKTTALQALALWWFGLVNWTAKKGASANVKKRTGVTLNRRDLIALPVPSSNLLWKDAHTRQTSRMDGKQQTKNVSIRIDVEGVLDGRGWSCALEFDYANPESLYCRPVIFPDAAQRELMAKLASQVRVAYLPPMSGLAPREFKAEMGQINVLIGEGQTAQVLRNLCWAVFNDQEAPDRWPKIVQEIHDMFGVNLKNPRYVEGTSEVEMTYEDACASGVELELSSAGRGMQQTLLLLTYLHANPGAILLLDEPDAHLEVLRQRQIYNAISRLAQHQDSQIIIATHSEVVLAEAAGKHTVIAFVGKPHRINDQGTQIRKSLLSIGYEHYLQADITGWVLYLEGSTDLSVLRSLARRLGHPAAKALDRPYVDYVNSNTPPTARDRFYGLREARPDLLGLALFDRLDTPMPLQSNAEGLTELCWRKREIENYLCTSSALLAWAESLAGKKDDLFVRSDRKRLHDAMRSTIMKTEEALRQLRKPSPWSEDIKSTDDFLDGLFQSFLEETGMPREMMYKKDYHKLADFIPIHEIDPEISEKLDAIDAISQRARPAQ